MFGQPAACGVERRRYQRSNVMRTGIAGRWIFSTMNYMYDYVYITCFLCRK